MAMTMTKAIITKIIILIIIIIRIVVIGEYLSLKKKKKKKEKSGLYNTYHELLSEKWIVKRSRFHAS